MVRLSKLRFSLLIMAIVISNFSVIKANRASVYKNNDYEFLNYLLKKETDEETISSSLIKRRAYFLEHFLEPEKLLEAYEKNKAIYSFKNSTDTQVRYQPDFLLTKSRLIRELDINDKDTDLMKSLKIYKFVASNFEELKPLYRETKEYVAPTSYFNTYYHGQCGVTASLVAYLAHNIGLEAIVYSLGGHLIACIYHDGAWRVYDAMRPDLMRIVNNLPATIDEMVYLGKQKQLKDFSDLYATTENNLIKQNNFTQSLPEPYFMLRPQEKLLLYDKLFMISTDNSYSQTKDKNDKDFSSDEFLKRYGEYSANHIRVLELDDIDLELEIQNFFPISGVFIELPEDFDMKKLKEKDFPYIETEFVNVQAGRQTLAKDRRAIRYTLADGKWPSMKVKAELLKTEGLKKQYLDLSKSLHHLEPSPSYSFKLKGLKDFRSKLKGSKLLIVSHNAKKIIPKSN